MKCNLCNYEWEAREDKPKQCPRCKRYDYNIIKDKDKIDIDR